MTSTENGTATDFLSLEEIDEIQQLHDEEEWTVGELAAEFEVNRAVIRDALALDLDDVDVDADD